MTDQKLQVIPLGGLGEFGMNMTAIRYGEDMIAILEKLQKSHVGAGSRSA